MRSDYIRYYEFSVQHRLQHGCGGYPYENGQELTEIADAADAKHILELGTAVGYSAYCFAVSHAKPHIDTIEIDAEHVRIAQEQLAEHNVSDAVRVLHGSFADIVPQLNQAYDLIFFDGFEPDPGLLEELVKHVQSEGSMVTANLSWSSSAHKYLDAFQAMGWNHQTRGDIAISSRLN